MKVQHISVGEWRHFRNIEICVPDDASVVCLVGGNGTGKSQLLELVGDAASRIGISAGYGLRRAQGFESNASLEVKFVILPNLVPHLDDGSGLNPENQDSLAQWDRTIVVRRTANSYVEILAGGVASSRATTLAADIVNLIGQSEAVHYLMLDADRAYPPVSINDHLLGQAFKKNWDAERKNRSFVLTKTLYDEWFQYLVGTENRENAKHIADIRRARADRTAEPTFTDKMGAYRDAIRQVLPHLLFTGISNQSRPEFDSAGVPLTFDELSGGEREIAFLIGQIERFGLRHGLLLVDEPELHLNYDLLRSWIGFLKSTVNEGQIWLATHSLEVVEVAGSQSTFLLERDEGTRHVSSARSLKDAPVVATLSRAIGSPAFSISNLSFVLVEGEEAIGERERFRLLCGMPPSVRFIEGGSCTEVERRLASLRAIALASREPLKIAGVVDRDWRSEAELRRLSELGLFVLPVHEVENYFLHPETIQSVMGSIGQDGALYPALLSKVCDARAGIWIFNAARTHRSLKDLPKPSEDTRELVHTLVWSDFAELSNAGALIAGSELALSDDQRSRLARCIEVYGRIFARQRLDGSSWRYCEGKEVFRTVASQIGFSDASVAESAILKHWVDKPDVIPPELSALRGYVGLI